MLKQTLLCRDKKYLDWIRGQECVVTGNTNGVVAHHVTPMSNRGTGQKPSDYWCLPIHAWSHNELHQVGERSYWKSMDIDPHKLAITYLVRWLIQEEEDGLELLRCLNGFAANRGM